MATRYKVIPESILEALCRTIGDIPQGLSGTDINKYLRDCNINNPTPDITKWKRLYHAFENKQRHTGVSNDVLKFITVALHPSRFLRFGDDYFNSVLKSVNEPLAFLGIEYSPNGTFRKITEATTISEAQQKANDLIAKLKVRCVHDDIYRYCKAELLVNNYFHAVFETTKGVADRIRLLSGLDTDGGALVSEAFASANPILIINNFTSETDKSEHKGFANLLIGFFGMFRNTLAHEAKILWPMTEQDALEIMTIASLCHRKLDNTHRIR